MNVADLAKRALTKYGKAATISWPGDGASLVSDAGDVSQRILFVPGKRETQIVGGVPVIRTNAIMSGVKRNPVGATITFKAQTYTVAVSDDLGDDPLAYAAHKLVLV